MLQCIDGAIFLNPDPRCADSIVTSPLFFFRKWHYTTAHARSCICLMECTLQNARAFASLALYVYNTVAGMYAVGRDVAEGVFVATHLTQACEVQQRTLSMAGGDISKVVVPTEAALDQQYADMMASTDYGTLHVSAIDMHGCVPSRAKV